MGQALTMVEDPGAFEAAVAGFLQSDPILNTLPLTILDQVRSGRYDEWLLGYVAGGSSSAVGGDVTAVCVRTPPFNLLVAARDEAGVVAIADGLDGQGQLLPGVTGIQPWADRFAELWTTRRGEVAVTSRRERLFRLDALVPPRPAGGRARQATASDVDQVLAWTRAFRAEAAPGLPPLDARAVRPALDAGRYWLWEDGRPVSLTGHTAYVAGQARVGPVYTPPSERGRGYASNLVAHVSRLLLRDVVPTLFTDLANPTSNKIYRAIGYTPVADLGEIRFESGGAANGASSG